MKNVTRNLLRHKRGWCPYIGLLNCDQDDIDIFKTYDTLKQ
jgi:hypothetical protein